MAMRWTKEAEDFLIRYYPTHDVSELAEALGTTDKSVRAKAKRLGLRKIFNLVPEGMKRCPRCEQIFSKEYFMSGYCKPCRNEIQRERKIKQLQAAKEAQDKEEQKLHNQIKEATEKLIYTCSICGKEKLGSEFIYDSRVKKRESRCKQCKNERRKESKIKLIKEGKKW